MRVAIVGSRGFAPLRLVRDYVDALPSDAVVVSGGARGVDQEAEFQAGLRFSQGTMDSPPVSHPADWKSLGRSAGRVRNQQIVEDADRVVAFWDEKSPGTLDTIKKAAASGKPVEIHFQDGYVWVGAIGKLLT